jgi:hypothetical protein
MSEPARTVSRRPVRRLLLAFINLDSFGSVMVFIFATYVLSVTVTASWGKALVLVVQIATVWLALRVSHARRVIRLAASIALAIALVVAVLSLVGVGDSNLSGAVFLASGILYLIAPVSIVRSLVAQPQVDQETVLGALDAYLFVGMAFAYLYATLGAIDPPFFQGGGSDTVPNTLFFSFTTLTTTGYGNLVPAANPGQSLAVLEMLIGQLFLVTAVAKVINAWRPARWQGDRPEEPSPASPEGPDGS